MRSASSALELFAAAVPLPEAGRAVAESREVRIRARMRIAFLVEKFPQLSETFILSQITALLDAGEEVHIYAWRTSEDGKAHPDVARYGLLERTLYLKPPPGRLARVARTTALLAGGRAWRRPSMLRATVDPRWGGGLSSRLAWLYAGAHFLRRDPYDVIHCQFGQLGLKALRLRDMGVARGRLVVSFRGADLTVYGAAEGYARLFREGDLFLPVCDRFKRKLLALGCEARKVRVHLSGISLSKFEYTPRRRDAGEPTRLLTVARLVEKKGVTYGIEAVARLKALGHRVRYTVVGDGVLRPELERTIQRLGLAEEVRLVGGRSHDDVIPMLRDAHILLAPSVTASDGDQEGMPVVLMEGMAMGLPVVSTLHSGIPELVQDGVSGFLVPERDVEALTDRLACLIDHPERWPGMGRAGRARIEAEYDIRKLNDELLARYRATVGLGASGGHIRHD